MAKRNRSGPDWHDMRDECATERKALDCSARMIIYNVTVTIEAAIEREWLDWMRRVHVPDVLRTGCFAGATIYTLVEPKSDEPTFVIQYRCSAMEEYKRYRDHFAAPLQKEHSDRFSGRFRASRQILEEV